jgi:hypothetical protein
VVERQAADILLLMLSMLQMVLERYPKNIKVLRAYAKFVEDVKSDPWTASHIYG